MAMEAPTFRDKTLSIYQSFVETVVRSKLPADAARPGLENSLIRAAAQVATFLSKGQALQVSPPGNVTAEAWTTARLAFELIQARLTGEESKAEQIEAELRDGPFDLDWAEPIAEYIEYFGPDGKLKTPQYIPVSADMTPLPFNPGAVIGMMADWGTGSTAAIGLLQEMALHTPDIIIHLGDIYYSGTPAECERNFASLLFKAFDRRRVTIYTLAGNHDMYCGGVGYYGLLKTLNPPPLPQQQASFFCLRSTDDRWQFVAMDTGYSDFDPLNVTDVLVNIDPAEQAWLTQRIAEFPGRTILLSQHQFFSAFAQIGPAARNGSLTAYNPKLDATYRSFADAAQGKIAAWFWGHEHTLTLYGPYRGLEKGRCIGHGAIPVLVEPGSDLPLKRIVDPPQFLPVTLAANDQVYMHGFVILRFDATGTATAEYYQENDGRTPVYTETL